MGKNNGPKGGRPPGRMGKGGTGPGPGYKPSKGGKGTSHKGGTSRGSSGGAAKSVVVISALIFGVPFLLFLASLAYVVVS